MENGSSPRSERSSATGVKTYKTEFGGKPLSVEIGRLANQANGSVLVQYGETSVLVTAVMSAYPETADFFPLQVDYEEKYYAAGKIKGSKWIKRETRPSEEAILTGRLIDRALRPRFNQKIRHEIQVVVTVLSYDGANDPDVLGIMAASLALASSVMVSSFTSDLSASAENHKRELVDERGLADTLSDPPVGGEWRNLSKDLSTPCGRSRWLHFLNYHFYGP